VNRADFVKNLGTGDNVELEAGQFFAKIWQVRNTGECIWNETYSIILVAGEALGQSVQITLPGSVKPGETINLRVNLIAPNEPGPHANSWMLQDPYGERFGVGSKGTEPLQVSIVTKPPNRPTPG
jgi:hypothetical protein